MFKYLYNKKLSKDKTHIISYFNELKSDKTHSSLLVGGMLVVIYCFYVNINPSRLPPSKLLEVLSEDLEKYDDGILDFFTQYGSSSDAAYWCEFFSLVDYINTERLVMDMNMNTVTNSWFMNDFFDLALCPAFFVAVREYFFHNAVSMRGIVEFIKPIYLTIGIEPCLENEVIFFKKISARINNTLAFEIGKYNMEPKNKKSNDISKSRHYLKGLNMYKMTKGFE